MKQVKLIPLLLLLVILLACLLPSALAEEAHVLDATADLAPMEQGAKPTATPIW